MRFLALARRVMSRPLEVGAGLPTHPAVHGAVRSVRDIAGFLAAAGLEVVEPGVVLAHEWRAEASDVGVLARARCGFSLVLAVVLASR